MDPDQGQSGQPFGIGGVEAGPACGGAGGRLGLQHDVFGSTGQGVDFVDRVHRAGIHAPDHVVEQGQRLGGRACSGANGRVVGGSGVVVSGGVDRVVGGVGVNVNVNAGVAIGLFEDAVVRIYRSLYFFLGDVGTAEFDQGAVDGRQIGVAGAQGDAVVFVGVGQAGIGLDAVAGVVGQRGVGVAGVVGGVVFEDGFGAGGGLGRRACAATAATSRRQHRHPTGHTGQAPRAVKSGQPALAGGGQGQRLGSSAGGGLLRRLQGAAVIAHPLSGRGHAPEAGVGDAEIVLQNDVGGLHIAARQGQVQIVAHPFDLQFGRRGLGDDVGQLVAGVGGGFDDQGLSVQSAAGLNGFLLLGLAVLNNFESVSGGHGSEQGRRSNAQASACKKTPGGQKIWPEVGMGCQL